MGVFDLILRILSPAYFWGITKSFIQNDSIFCPYLGPHGQTGHIILREPNTDYPVQTQRWVLY